MAYNVNIDEHIVRELDDLDPPVAHRILKFLSGRVAVLEDPRSIGEALKGSALGAFWKYRVGDWRIVADIDDSSKCVTARHIGKRDEVYKWKPSKPDDE